MIDKEKVIKKLAFTILCDSEAGWNTIELPIEQAKDILALLKEQEAVVRCKDCKYDPRNNSSPEELPYWFPCKNGMRDQDWFCADGESGEI